MSVKVSVKMGSRQFKIEVNKATKCQEFISNVLQRVKVDQKLATSYAVFESIAGIERQLHSADNVIQTEKVDRKIVQYIIRKYAQTTLPQCNDKRIKQIYMKMHEKSQRVNELKVVDDCDMKRSKTKQNPLCNQHYDQLTASLANNKLADNINFLQFLYFKLKKQNLEILSESGNEVASSDCKLLIDNNSCGNSSDEEGYGSGSSCHTSSSNLRCESLV